MLRDKGLIDPLPASRVDNLEPALPELTYTAMLDFRHQSVQPGSFVKMLGSTNFSPFFPTIRLPMYCVASLFCQPEQELIGLPNELRSMLENEGIERSKACLQTLQVLTSSTEMVFGLKEGPKSTGLAIALYRLRLWEVNLENHDLNGSFILKTLT